MVITISCPSCLASFPVDTEKVPEAGVNVRCSSCSEIFRVERPDEAEAELAPRFEEAGAGVSEPETESADEWVVETAVPMADPMPSPPPDLDTSFFTGPADVEESVSVVEEEPLPTFGAPVSAEPAMDEGAYSFGAEPALEEEPLPTFDEPALEEEPLPAFNEPALEEEPLPAFNEPVAAEPAVEEPVAAEPASAVGGFSFGQRDPLEKARRLARVLVSDMIMYNPERHERALANNTLKEDFEEEIEKSWKEYIEQVGEDLAEGSDFWKEALNDVLAKGEPIF